MNEEFIKITINEAKKAYQEGEIPVGAIIVKNGEIISKTHNMKEKLNCSVKHAEILAIEEASKKINSWRLNDCEMYVSMEPCIMCCGALLQSRIKKIYYIVGNEKFGGLGNIEYILNNKKSNHHIEYEKIEKKEYIDEIQNLLKDFFIKKR